MPENLGQLAVNQGGETRFLLPLINLNRGTASKEIGINGFWSQLSPLLKGITLRLIEA